MLISADVVVPVLCLGEKPPQHPAVAIRHTRILLL